MFRKWKFIFLLTISVLVACRHVENRLTKVQLQESKRREKSFHANDKNRTEEIDGIKLYKPAGFKINDKSDAQNIVFTKNEETFILFINPNEKSDSKLFYDLLFADESKEIVEQATFTDEGIFGFAAVVKSGNDEVELIASVGGSKMTTLTKKETSKKNLAKMMEIVRSIKRGFLKR